MTQPVPTPNPLLAEVRQLIDAARQRVASAVNAELTQLYWHIGRRISAELLQGQRGEYGKQVVAELARQLTVDFGKGWSERQLRYCVRAAEVFPDAQILHTLCSQLSWSHLRLVIHIEDPLKRDFYIEICRVERWSVRQLQERINSLLFERTAISKKPEEPSGKISGMGHSSKYPRHREAAGRGGPSPHKRGHGLPRYAFHEPAPIRHRERSAAIHRRKSAVMDCRTSFAMTAIACAGSWFVCRFGTERATRKDDLEAAYKGQMELYLRYLEKHEQMEGEATPIGLILCTGKSEEHVELLQLPQSNIRVADYLTLLPPRETLQAKLHQSIAIARQKLQRDADQ